MNVTLTAEIVHGVNALAPLVAVVHEVNAPDGLLLDHGFYLEFGHAVPQGLHYELELTDPTIWTHAHRDMIHHRQSTLNERRFVCYPLPMPTRAKARDVFTIWALGTAFTMMHGKDFQLIHTGDNLAFMRIMSKTYHLNVAHVRFSDLP
jgi:hypothetical protein